MAVKISVFILLLGAVGVGVFYWLSSDSSNINSETTEVRQVSQEEVSAHASETDCWTIIDSKVYNITTYVPLHPGGKEILEACGTDGTDFFNGNNSENKRHGRSERNLLDAYFIGDLIQ